MARTIKACGWADGHTSRLNTDMEEISSPALSIKAMILSWTMDAKKNWYVVSDIPRAFSHAQVSDKNVHMLLKLQN